MFKKKEPFRLGVGTKRYYRNVNVLLFLLDFSRFLRCRHFLFKICGKTLMDLLICGFDYLFYYFFAKILGSDQRIVVQINKNLLVMKYSCV